MPQYKLTYFNIPGVAEPIRWIFKIAGVDFEDERIEPKDWPTLKKSGRFPTETLPLLDVDGEVITQSRAILRFLGSRFGLTVDDEMHKLRLDQAIGLIDDIRTYYRAFFTEQDPQRKEEAKKTLVNYAIPLHLKQIETIAARFPGDYLLGTKLTFADLIIASSVDSWSNMGLINGPISAEYPALAKLQEAVFNVPQIKAYVALQRSS